MGRFSAKRKPLLDELYAALNSRGWIPLLFDFEAPKGITQTFKMLASLAGYIIADVTDAAEIRVEIRHIVDHHRNVPIQPVLLDGKSDWFGSDELRGERALILDTFRYKDRAHLIRSVPALMQRMDKACEPPTTERTRSKGKPKPGRRL